MNGNNKHNAETQLEASLNALLEVGNDKTTIVQDALNMSLRKIAKDHPNDVLKACSKYYEKNSKLTGENLSVILTPMETICREQIVLIDGDTIFILIDFCYDIMTKSTYEYHVHLNASAVLVALGNKHCAQIVEGLLKKSESGIVPHYSIPHTLGSLASGNTYGIVPYLKKILTFLIPLLGSIKADIARQAFAYALDSFSEALIEYTTNLQHVPDPTIRLDDFQTEMCMAYDILFNNWLNSREVKVTETILNALSTIFNVLNAEKIRQHTLKTVQVLVGFLKKQRVTQASSKCLYSVISVAARTDGTLLEPLTHMLLQTLSELVCVSPDYAQPELLRTHSEVLRCFECLAVYFTDHTLDHLLQQIKNNNERERVKVVCVLTHLVNSSESSIKTRLGDVLCVLRYMLNDTSVKMKRSLLKIIVAIAYKDFLGSKDLQDVKFMEFIVTLCSKHVTTKESNNQEVQELKQTADNALYLLSTSVPVLEGTLWNLLLSSFLSNDHDEACIILLRCLTHLASKGLAKEPSESAFVKSLIYLTRPTVNFKGTFTLNFLRNIKPCANDDYKSVWETQIPHLLKYLEQNYEELNENEWEEMLFDFVSILLSTVKDETFKESLIVKAKEQLIYQTNNKNEDRNNLIEKRFLLKFMATVSCYVSDKQLVLHVLDIILETIRSPDTNELQCCSKAMGICSRTHLKMVLDKLEALRKDVLLKKSKFFGLIKDQKSESSVERVRYVVITSYAEVCNEAPSDDLLRTIQSDILDFVTEELQHCSERKVDFVVRASCLKTIGAVADAMHPNRNKLHINMQDRDNILRMVSVQLQLHNGPEYIELFPVILPVLLSLVRLPPTLETETRMNLLKLCFNNVFNASAIYCKMNNNVDGHVDLKLAQYIYSSFTKLYQLVQELLQQCLTPATLDEIITLLEAWFGLKKPEQRLPALEALRVVLQTYLDNVKFAYNFNQTGFLLGKVIPRCTDPNVNIRKIAVECVYLILCIANRYEGRTRDYDKQLHNSLFNILENIDTDDPKTLFNVTTELAQIVANNNPTFQMNNFVESLLEGLQDVESASSTGTSVVLNNIIKLKGGELSQHASEITKKMVNLLDEIKCQRTRSNTIRAVHSMATHHLRMVVQIVLNQQLPYSQSVKDCWAYLANDDALITDIVEQLKKIMKGMPLFKEQQQNADKVHIATLPTLQAVSAFTEFFKHASTSELSKQQFPELFTLLLITLASYIGTTAPVEGVTEKKERHIFVPNRDAYKLEPAKVCKETFKLFLHASGCANASNVALQADVSTVNAFVDTVDTLVDVVCNENAQSLSWLVAALGPYSRSDVDAQRIAVAAFFAALLRNNVNGQTLLAENILELLLDVHSDANFTIRKLCYRGLGHAAEHLNRELIVRFSNNILSALLQGLDYHNISNEADVALETMLSFSKLLNVVDQKHLGNCQVTAAVRIKPLLEQDNVLLRRASIRLLGDLASSVVVNEAFKEQVQGNLVGLLLHLNDDDTEVIRSSKYTLRKVAQFLDSSDVSTMIKEHLLEDGNLHFTHFVTDLVKVMADPMQELFPQLILTCLAYFKSPWTKIRSHAVLLCGLLFVRLNAEHKNQISSDNVSHKLLQLLRDDEAEVRARAVEAIAYLFVA